jgi:hypothetical protein
VFPGMNDVINSQGYTRGHWNRIPIATWYLMAAITLRCNVPLGTGCKAQELALLLPLLISISVIGDRAKWLVLHQHGNTLECRHRVAQKFAMLSSAGVA